MTEFCFCFSVLISFNCSSILNYQLYTFLQLYELNHFFQANNFFWSEWSFPDCFLKPSLRILFQIWYFPKNIRFQSSLSSDPDSCTILFTQKNHTLPYPNFLTLSHDIVYGNFHQLFLHLRLWSGYRIEFFIAGFKTCLLKFLVSLDTSRSPSTF